MKIVVVGGTGLIGAKLVGKLSERGHEAVAASRRLGVDTVTGEGLGAALDGASVVVDVTNPPPSDRAAPREFFETSTRNLRAAEEAAGVGYHVVLSIVGSERLPDSDYYRAKVAQETLVEASPVSHSIVRATQFFEFIATIAEGATVGDTVLLPAVLLQPVAADDVADAIARVSVAPPLNGTVEVAGPDRSRLEVFVRRVLAARNDPREVLTDPRGSYFGAVPSEDALVPRGSPLLGETRFDDWLRRSVAGHEAA